MPYLTRDSLTFFDMHIKSKHFSYMFTTKINFGWWSFFTQNLTVQVRFPKQHISKSKDSVANSMRSGFPLAPTNQVSQNQVLTSFLWQIRFSKNMISWKQICLKCHWEYGFQMPMSLRLPANFVQLHKTENLVYGNQICGGSRKTGSYGIGLRSSSWWCIIGCSQWQCSFLSLQIAAGINPYAEYDNCCNS